MIETADAAAALGQSPYAASKTLSRLAASGLVSAVRHGVWWMGPRIDAYRLHEYLTAPLPSYLSLQTALHLHGMVEQIPETYYAVSLARTQRIATSAGHFSIHHVDPVLYGGFEETPSGAKIASPEKAIFDLAYLSGGATRLFAALPELELPPRFRWREVEHWVGRVPSQRSRTLVGSRIERFLGGQVPRRLAHRRRVPAR
ncbi:MAG: type IV toxin-antitoxin system AbiEi family antitoxin domain-containing protein [Polyangiaceae bacterium]